MLGRHPKDVQVTMNVNLPERGTSRVRINKDTEMDYPSGHHMHPSKTATEETGLERKITSLTALPVSSKSPKTAATYSNFLAKM